MPRRSRSGVVRQRPARVAVEGRITSTLAAHPRPILALAGLSVVCLIASLTIAKISTNDVWIHVKTGELILAQHAVPQKDPYSFTASDHDYVAHEWLSGVIFYVVYSACGVPGLILLKSAVVLLTGIFLLLICRTHSDRLSVVLPAFGVMSYVAGGRYLERPHIFSYVLASVYLFLFFRYRDGGRRRLWLLAILPLQVVWANMHGGFAEGLLLAAVCAGGELTAWVRARYMRVRWYPVLSGTDLALVAGLPVLAVAVSLINPYGVRLLELPFQLTGMQAFMAAIYEWASPFIPVYRGNLAFYGYGVWLAVLFASFFGVRRNEAAPSSWRAVLPALNAVFFAALLLFCYAFLFRSELLVSYPWLWATVGLLFCAANVHRLDCTETGIVVLMVALSMQHNRNVSDAVVVTFPVLCHNLSSIVERYTRARQWRFRLSGQRVGGSHPAVVIVWSLLLLAEAAHVLRFGYYHHPGSTREGGFGIARGVPVCAVNYIMRRGLSGNAYTSYTAAGMLVHRGHPAVKVGMDSRNEVYGEALFREYLASVQSAEGMRDYLERHHVDFFLADRADLNVEVLRYLIGGGQWVQVFFDDRYLVLVRNAPEFSSAIAADAYQNILLGQPVRPIAADNAEAYLQESTRAADDCPDAWLPRWYRAEALRVLGRDREAVAENLEVVRRNPGAWQAWAALGQLYTQLDDRTRAIDAYHRALAINPGYRPAVTGLGRLQAF